MARIKVQVPVESKPRHNPHTQINHHTESHQAPGSPSKSSSVKKAALIIAVILLVIFVMSLISEKNQLQKEARSNTSSQKVEDIVGQISKSVELPTDETPQMRTIEDASRFKQSSEVLDEINDGDVWIFYPKAGKQVFYRPSTKKVIFVVPLAPTTDTTQQNRQR